MVEKRVPKETIHEKNGMDVFEMYEPVRAISQIARVHIHGEISNSHWAVGSDSESRGIQNVASGINAK